MWRAVWAREEAGRPLFFRSARNSSAIARIPSLRTFVARAFASRPSILLADEPTGNLDSATGAHVLDLLLDLREARGTTLVLVTHDPAIAARADREVHLRGGRIESAR